MGEESSAFAIEELEGDKRVVRLVGSGQPFRPSTWESQQSLQTTWYPGNPEASQQVLGPQDLPSDFEGMWRRTLLGRTPATVDKVAVVHPMELCSVMDDIRLRGHRLRVTWAAVDGTGADRGKIVREGRLQKFGQSPDRVDDIAWKMHFEWLGRGRNVQRVSVSRDGDYVSAIVKAKSAANALASLNVAMSAISSAAKIPGSATRLTLGQLESLANAPAQLVNAVTREANRIVSDLDRIGKLVNKVRAIPASLAGSALATAHNAIAVANRFQDQLSRTPPEALSARASAADVVRAASLFGRTSDVARGLAGAAHELARRGEQQAPKRTMLGIHVVRRGDTMSSIASKWYGNADLTEKICRSNKLPLGTVTPGRPTLVIPAL